VSKCSCYAHNGFLTAKGLKEAAQQRAAPGALDATTVMCYLYKYGSVSALDEDEDGELAEQLMFSGFSEGDPHGS